MINRITADTYPAQENFFTALDLSLYVNGQYNERARNISQAIKGIEAPATKDVCASSNAKQAARRAMLGPISEPVARGRKA